MLFFSVPLYSADYLNGDGITETFTGTYNSPAEDFYNGIGGSGVGTVEGAADIDASEFFNGDDHSIMFNLGTRF